MDDEASIRRVVENALRTMGHDVRSTADGAEALRAFEDASRQGRPFHLVILDLTVPGGMGGRETIGRLRQLDSHVPAVVSSGYSDDPVMADFQSHGFQAVVSKPYDLPQLMAIVKRLLSRPS